MFENIYKNTNCNTLNYILETLSINPKSTDFNKDPNINFGVIF